MKKKDSETQNIKFVTHLKDIPIPSEMPSPPEFLMKKLDQTFSWEDPAPSVELDSTAIAALLTERHIEEASLANPMGENFAALEAPLAPETPSAPKMRTVDYGTYSQAVEERISAETGYAEMYSKYLEMVTFNEKTLRTVRRFKKYQEKFRELYNRAQQGDEHLRNSFKIIQRNMVATEKAMSDMQIENESLRISLMSHEEAYKGALAQIGIQQAETENTQKQFRALADEFENRGILLDEADRKIRGYLTQIDQLGNALRELREKYDITHEHSILADNRARESQLREAGINTLNDELAQAVTKSQKQIRELEDRLKFITEDSTSRIMSLETEIERLRENRRAEELVEHSRRMLKNASTKPVIERPAPTEATRKQWDDFYNRWSAVIDGLSSHSVPIDRPMSPKGERTETLLVSESGDLEIL